MKRIYGILLAAALLLGLCGCGGQEVSQWQTQYELGVSCFDAANYPEAVTAFSSAIRLDPQKAEAYLGLVDAYAAMGDYGSAYTILAAGISILEDTRLTERMARLEREIIPVGSEEFLQLAAARLPQDRVDFDLYLGGMQVSAATIQELCKALGGEVKHNDSADAYFLENADPASAVQYEDSAVVDAVFLLSLMGEAEDVRIWPEEYFAGILPGDTLAQVLEKLGFGEEERAYLGTCPSIALALYDNLEEPVWNLRVSTPEEPEDYAVNQCTLYIRASEQPISYTFTFAMEQAFLADGSPTPVDGSAVMQTMQITNYMR